VTKYLFYILVFVFICQNDLLAQGAAVSSSDSLVFHRKAFTTKVFRDTNSIKDNKLSMLLKPSAKWSRKFKISRILLPAGPLVAAGGIFLAYDAIKGIPMEAEIDGTVYPYTVRSLPKLLGGIAIFVGGMSMVESANETKGNAVKWYNGYLSAELDNKKTALDIQLRFGIQESGRIGFVMKF
jgi:hypothetical protein